jgi:hypothetical protein
MKKMALLFGMTLFAFAGTTHSSTAQPEAPMTSTMDPQDDDDDDGGPEAACASQGSECLTKGAPKCCRGLRCVGYVCKK